MSSGELMECWTVDRNGLGVYCLHIRDSSRHALQQLLNGWVFYILEPSSSKIRCGWMLRAAHDDVAGAQREAHKHIEQQEEDMIELLDFYDRVDPTALTTGWQGPDNLGGYGFVDGNRLYIINRVEGLFRMQRLVIGETYIVPATGDDMPIIEGRDWDDVLPRALEHAKGWK